MTKEERFTLLTEALNYRFQRPDLLEDALTHPSVNLGRGSRGAAHGSGRGPAASGHGAAPASGRRRTSYERLEFLGDRVLGLVVAEMLFQRFPNENEGALARRHAALVRREALARVALILGLDRALLVSKGEDESGGRHNPTMLADACEALLGAIYADGGLEPASRVIRQHWESLMAEAATPPKDAKTALQEWAQARGKPLPVYGTVGVEGPPHDPSFLVSVTVEGHLPMHGRGTSKRAAEQDAATAMLEVVGK